MDRREFLIAAALAGATVSPGLLSVSEAADGVPGAGPTSRPREEKRGEMIYRELGRTGEMVSVIGLGGYHIGTIKEKADSIRLIRTAIDRGITFLDNCWDYHDGKSELWMGEALRDGYRKQAFLMSKLDARDADTATQQIDESLRRLQTDHVDLMQFHEILRPHDPDVIFADGGAWKAMDAARKAGKVRFVGFTGHKDPFIHLRMLQEAKAHGVHMDTVQMPLNVMDAHFRSFAREVVPAALADGVAVLGMKPLGSGIILKSGAVKAIECLHYAMNLPTSVVITGIDGQNILDQALEAVRTFKPMDEQQVAGLLKRTAEPARGGEYEPFKTTFQFDGTTQNPKWMGKAVPGAG